MTVGVPSPSGARYKYTVDFQSEIVVAMAKDPRFALDYADVLMPTYFERDVHIVLARMILDHVNRHRVNPTTAGLLEHVHDYCTRKKIHDTLRDDLMREVEFIRQHDLNGLGQVQDSVVNFGRTQALRRAWLDAAPILEDEDVDNYDSLRSLLDQALSVGAAAENPGMEFGAMLPKLGAMAAENALYNPQAKVTTGFPTLDSCLGGGMAPSELLVMLAPTKTGKSVLLVNLAAAALSAQTRVIFYTFELSEFDVLMRTAARLTGNTMDEIQQDSPEFKAQAHHVASFKPYMKVFYFPPGRMSPDNLRAHLSRVCDEDGIQPGAIIIDYPDKMKKVANRYGEEDSYSAMGKIYEELIGIGHDFHAPVLGASQANRSADKSKPIEMESSADSYKKMMDADVVVSISRTKKEKERNVLRLFVAGARRGEDSIVIPCATDYKRMHVQEITMDQYEGFMV